MSNPICTIIAWYGNPLRRPNNYEFCNGNPIDKVTFPDLYGYLISANPSLYINPEQCYLPNLQGEFLRGYDKDRGIDPNRDIGLWQDHALFSHAHTIGNNVGIAQGWNGGWGGAGGTHPVLQNAGQGGLTTFGTVNTGEKETRPRNVAVSFLIKATRNGEERSLRELIEDFPQDYPGGIYDVLRELADQLDGQPQPNP